ncbi:MAG: hypothetical protein EPO32_14475 [Anaerolineae bacterium]|nr:MAG: hypothetical protein EPO32_14475 [Anaerolineae bacterium]
MDIGMLFIVMLFVGVMLFFANQARRQKGRNLRDIPAFYKLQGALEVAVEDGTRLHVAIGRSDITSPQSAAALVGLSMLRRIATVASESDNPPVSTSGNGLLAILAQDTLRATYSQLGLFGAFENDLGRVTGLTPFSYAAGTIHLIRDEEVSGNVMAGTFGEEAALIAGAGERRQILTLAGSDTLTGQAVLVATAHEPLIGEELYAGGSYLGAGAMHDASLHAQDVARWLVALGLIGGALLGLLGGLAG